MNGTVRSSRPPGFSTRRISWTRRTGSTACSSTSVQRMASSLASSNGRSTPLNQTCARLSSAERPLVSTSTPTYSQCANIASYGRRPQPTSRTLLPGASELANCETEERMSGGIEASLKQEARASAAKSADAVMLSCLDVMVAMLVVLTSWLLLGALLVGIGLVVERAVVGRAPAPHAETVWMAFWMGWAAVIGGLQILHLWLGVGWIAFALIALVGVAGLVVHRALVAEPLRATWRRRPLMVALGLVAIWLADRALGPPIGDTARNLNAVMWNVAHPIVPGLANLHGRLGFNNAAQLWAALLDATFWPHRSFHLANGILVCTWMFRSVDAVISVVVERAQLTRSTVFSLVIAPVLVTMATTLHELRISSLETDVPPALVALALAAVFIRRLDARDQRPGDVAYEWAWSATLLGLMVCLKLSNVVYAAVAWSLLSLFYWGATPAAARWRSALFAIALPAIWIGVWIVRTAILTGYPLFPAGALPLPVDWRLPEPARLLEVEGIESFFMPPVALAMERYPGDWFRPWLIWQATRCPELVLLPTLLATATLPLLVRLRHAAGEFLRGALPLIIAAVVAIAFWLATAPHPRFAFWMFWELLALALAALGPAAARRWRPTTVLLCWAPVMLFPMAHRVAAFLTIGQHDNAAAVLFIPPGPDHGFHPAPTVTLMPRTTRSGLTVFVPPDQDCWEGQLLCAARWVDDLALRKPGRVSDGFRRDGETPH